MVLDISDKAKEMDHSTASAGIKSVDLKENGFIDFA